MDERVESTEESFAPETSAERWWRWACLGFAGLALLIAAVQVYRWAIDVPLWDDFDGFLNFLVRLDDARTASEKLAIAAEFHNEHRTLTTRLVVWAVRDWTGAFMDFRALALAAAGLLVPIAALFVWNFRAREERIMAAALAGAFLFSLQLHEVLFWGGACEHVSSVLFAMLALYALRWRAPAGLLLGTGLAALAAFTLAHGFVAFPAGAIVLALERRWRDAAFLLFSCAVFAGFWMVGYHGNPLHGSLQPTLSQALDVLWFWLGMLGTPLAYGQRLIAPWLGAAVLIGGVALVVVTGWREYRYHLSVMLYALGAALLVAIGRAPMDPHLFMGSRYRLLACLVLATLGVLLFVFVRRIRPRFPVQWVLLALAVAYAAEKTQAHWNRGREHHDRLAAAARHYAEGLTLRGAPTELYYDIGKADHILSECRKRRIYDLRAVGQRPKL